MNISIKIFSGQNTTTQIYLIFLINLLSIEFISVVNRKTGPSVFKTSDVL